MKALKIQLKINKYKKSVFQQWFKSSNYVYNKSVVAIQKGDPSNFIFLRDKFVTANTKKTNPEYQRISSIISKLRKEKKTSKNTDAIDSEIENYNKQLSEAKKEMKSVKNPGVYEWELQTPKEIRAEAIQDVCKAYKTAHSNLRQGNIKRFNIGFRKKKDNKQSLVIPKSFIKNNKGMLTIAPTFFNEEENPSISMGKRTMKEYKNIEIEHDCRLVKKHNEYWLFIPVSLEEKTKNVKWKNYSGVDPGERTFMTTFGNQGCYEYEHNRDKVANTDKRINLYKQRKKQIRKRSYLKQERRKENLIDEIHWCTIKALLKNNDILFYGDIKSHNIVRGNKNQTLNRGINNLKFYQFKQRLEFKASEQGKKVILVKEHNTTKTCSFCGTLNDPGSSKIYECKNCKKRVGRDVNASKNILMKGMKAYL
jgi:IS605 OrfB family transposase